MERPNSIYVSYEVRKALRMLAKSQAIPADSHPGVTISADQIADNILSQYISLHHPQLFEYQHKIEEMENELIKNLGA